MAFDPKKDYTAAISKTTDAAEKARLEAEKAEKVASMKSGGLDPTKTSDVQAYNAKYAGDNQRYEFNMNAPTVTGGGFTGGGGLPSVNYGQQMTDYQALARQLEEQRINAGIAGLQKAKQSALTGISAQRQQLPEQTRAGITQARVVSDQARKQMRDYFAQRFGESASGSQAQADIAQNVAQQGAETQYNLQEQAQMAELARREGDINAGYESDVASIRAGAQADTMANILARQQQLQGLEASQSLANQQLQYQEGLRTQEQQREDALKTIDRDYSDLTAGINRIKNDNDPSNDWLIPYYETRRSEKLQTIETSKEKLSQLQSEAQRKAYEDALERTKVFGQVQPSDASILGLPSGTKTQSADIQDLKLALQQARASKSSRGSGSGSGGTSYIKPPTNKSSAQEALAYLNTLKAKGDLIGIQTFIQNNMNDIDQMSSGRVGTLADQQAANEIQRTYYAYR